MGMNAGMMVKFVLIQKQLFLIKMSDKKINYNV